MKAIFRQIMEAVPRQTAEAHAGGTARDFYGTGIFLFALAFATSSAGCFSPSLEFFLYTGLTAWFLIARRLWSVAVVVGVVGMCGLGLAVPAGLSRWTGLWHVLVGLTLAEGMSRACGRTGRAEGARASGLGLYILVAAGLLVFDVVVLGNPAVRPGVDRLMRDLSSRLTASADGRELPLGTTYWSVPVLLAYLLIGVAQPEWRRRALWWAGGAVSVVVYFKLICPIQAGALAGPAARALSGWYDRQAGAFQNLSEPITRRFMMEWISLLRPQLILMGMLAAWQWVVSRFWAERDQEPAPASGAVRPGMGMAIGLPAALGAAVGALLAMATATETVDQSALTGRKVAVMTSNIDMSVPTHGSYGFRSVGMFGRMPGFIRSLGMDVQEVNGVGQLNDEHEILILANLQESFSPWDRQRIWDWVRAGGGLLVLTDHTGDKGLRLPANELLAPFGLEVRFDSAKLFSEDGGFDYEMWMGSPLQTVRDVRFRGAQQYGTGGSIEASGSAIPLMQARYAFVDPGSFTAIQMGNLGNLHYDIGENLGDVPLIGFARADKGRVILSGDTSPFQNGAGMSSHEFVRQILGTLLPDGPVPLGRQPLVWVATGLAILSLLGLAWWSRSAVGPFCLAMAVVWGLGWSWGHRYHAPPVITGTHVAVIDLTHCPYAGLQDWTNTDLTGLTTCLVRDGYCPIFCAGRLTEQLARLGEGDYLFLISPLWEFSKAETRQIGAFMDRGGTVVVNCGYEQAERVNQFLGPFGLHISSVTLGTNPDQELRDPLHVHFANAWQVEGDGEVLHRLRGRPVAVQNAVGKGRLIVIGDSKFFWDTNIESRERHRQGNIAFLSRLVGRQGTVETLVADLAGD